MQSLHWLVTLPHKRLEGFVTISGYKSENHDGGNYTHRKDPLETICIPDQENIGVFTKKTIFEFLDYKLPQAEVLVASNNIRLLWKLWSLLESSLSFVIYAKPPPKNYINAGFCCLMLLVPFGNTPLTKACDWGISQSCTTSYTLCLIATTPLFHFEKQKTPWRELLSACTLGRFNLLLISCATMCSVTTTWWDISSRTNKHQQVAASASSNAACLVLTKHTANNVGKLTSCSDRKDWFVLRLLSDLLN